MGAMQGIWMAEQAMEKERLDQSNLDLRTKSEDRLDKKFQEDFTNNRLKNLSDSGFNFGLGGSSSSGSGSGDGSLLLSAETENTLKKIVGLLPEDSLIAPKLVNANLKSLQSIVAAIEARQASSANSGLPLTPDAIEGIFKDIYVTNTTSQSSLNVQDLASYLQVDLESEYVGGVTWNEYLTKQISPKTATSVDFSQKFSVGTMSATDIKSIRGSFQSDLLQGIEDGISEFNQNTIRVAELKKEIQKASDEGKVTETLEKQLFELNKQQELFGKYRQAQSDLKLTTPVFGLATSLVGVDRLLDYVQNFPLMKQPNVKKIFNKGLTYNEEEDLKRAINMGFVVKGEKINWKGNILIITDTIIDQVRSTNP